MSASWQSHVARAVEALKGIGLTSAASIFETAVDVTSALAEADRAFMTCADICEWDRNLGADGVSAEAHGSVVAAMGVLNDVIAELTIIARRAA